jgi:Type IV secretion-system coupling protein DNA-binding domain
MQARYSRYPSRPLALAALTWGTPILVLAQAQGSPFMTGATALQTNILILRCSGSENGGTSHFASRLIGEREVLRRQTSRGRDRESGFVTRGARRSTSTSQHRVTEAAVLASELEQLPDLSGYLKTASSPVWLKVNFRARC